MASDDARPRSSLIVPLLFMLVGLGILLGLGFWQLERKAWKEGLIATLNAKLAAPASDLPTPEAWPGLTAERDEFTRVRLTATFLPGRDALVFTNGSPLRPDVKGIGYWVFTPARLADGRLIAINRGFVPEAQGSAARLPADAAPAPVDMVGALRWPEPRGAFTPADDLSRGMFFVRDIPAMAAALGWGDVPAVYIDLESPAPAGPGPRPGPLAVSLPNRHFEYAITWFGLAASLVAVFGFWVASRRRSRLPFPDGGAP